MSIIVKEKLVSFKELEQKIYQYFCELAREATSIILEEYDRELAEGRDKKNYRDKGPRTTSIKTVYGEVTYNRHVYRTTLEDGHTAHVYLLDEAMHMDKIGLISTNLAEKIAMEVAESPYRVTAEAISNTCGQSISHGGVWHLVQQLGERINREEEQQVAQMNADQTEGTRAVPVLFEEMDGVWIAMQGRGHKKTPSKEMKSFTMYEGWDAEMERSGRSTLVGKKVLVGMGSSREFHEKREAMIRKIYDADEISQRILNGDGGNWIKEAYDPDVIFQLDRYHIFQEILRRIKDKSAQKEIRRLFELEQLDEMFEYIEAYANSVASDDPEDNASNNAKKLYQYLASNRSGLLSYQHQGIKIPDAPEGVLYKGMGVQENQNCTVITQRMKGGRKRWSENGADNMANVLYRKENKELVETIERYTDGLVFSMQMSEVLPILSAAKAPKRDGKGDSAADVITHHMPLFDVMQTAARKAFRRSLCC